MTIEEFLNELAQVKDNWELVYDFEYTGGPAIRTQESCDCPIIAVAKMRGFSYSAYEVESAAEALGLNLDDARKVIDASDGEGELRSRLEHACRLGELD
jgi:hypothetical protein